jgi:uncharacterized OB-fold protein
MSARETIAHSLIQMGYRVLPKPDLSGPRCPDCGLAPDPGEGECPTCCEQSEAEYVERQMYAAAYEDGYADGRRS